MLAEACAVLHPYSVLGTSAAFTFTKEFLKEYTIAVDMNYVEMSVGKSGSPYVQSLVIGSVVEPGAEPRICRNHCKIR